MSENNHSGGWNRPGGTKVEKKGVQPNVHIKSLLAAALVVVGACFAWWWISRGGEEKLPAKEVKPTKIREVKPAPAPKPAKKVEEVPVVTNGAPAWVNAKGLDPSLFPYKDGRKVLSTRTNSWDQVIDICMMPNGVRRKVRRNAKPPTYNNVSDQVIAMAVSGDMDDELPPIPISEDMEADFVESLKTPIVINDDDSEAIKESKRRVIEARTIIDEEMKKGRGFREILADHIAQRKANAAARETVMEAVNDLKKEGDPELLNQYLEKANAFLREKGIREVEDMPHRKGKEDIQ